MLRIIGSIFEGVKNMTETEFGEYAKTKVFDVLQKVSDESVEYFIASLGGGSEFTVVVKRRPERQIAERQRRKDRGERLY